MLTQIRSQLVPAAAWESAYAELCLQPPLLPQAAQPKSVRDGAALSRHPGSDRHRCVLGAIHRIGYRQSPSNPHTATALAA